MNRSVSRGVRLPAIVIAAGALTSCASLEGYAREPEPPAVINTAREAYYGAYADQAYNAATDPAERKRIRDLLIYGKMGVIEHDFDDLERQLNSTGNSVSLVGDLAVLSLSGIGSVTGGKSTKAALSAASAGIVGAQGAISKDLYYQRTLSAILAQMEANRERVRATIFAAMKKPDAEYPLTAAEIDLKQLIRAGSIPASISQITQGANESKQNSEDAIAALRNITFSSAPSSDKLGAWLAPGSIVDPTHTAAFTKWIKAQPDAAYLTSVPFVVIVRGPDPVMEAVRQRALADPKLGIPK